MKMQKILNSIVNIVLHQRTTVEVRFSQHGFLFHDGFNITDRWVIFSISRWNIGFLRRWTRPARIQGAGEPIDAPPPRLKECSFMTKFKEDVDALRRELNEKRGARDDD